MPGSDIRDTDEINNEINESTLLKEQEAEVQRQNTLRQMELNRINQAKKEAAQKIFDNISNLDNRINNLEAQINQIPQLINNSIQQAFSQIQQPQQIPTTLTAIDDPMVKANVLAQLAPAVTELIKVIKGGNAPTEDYFGNMSKEITMNMLRAGVDGIMQNVYHNYNPIPPKNSWQGQAPQDDKHRL